MKNFLLCMLCVVMLGVFPSVASAKRMPLFFNTGDELFEIEGAPQFEDGYSLGYACSRFGVFWADVWTWNCELMAINIDEFSVIELPSEIKTEYAQQYSLSDRKRNPWNHYGVFVIIALVIGGLVIKMRDN